MSKIEPNYILVASGSIVTMQLNIIVFADSDDRAREQAIAMVKSLHTTYHIFDLYSVSGEHVWIDGFRAETVAPTIVSTNRA